MGWLLAGAQIARFFADFWEGLRTYQNNIVALDSLITTSIVIFSLLVAYSQFRRAAHLQRRATSSQLWDAYLGRALKYPMFAYPRNFADKFDFEKKTFRGSPQEFERYEWFVSTLLRVSDEMLMEFGDRHHNCQAALLNVKYHRRYLKWRSMQNNQEDYIKIVSSELRRFIEDEVAKEDMPVKGAASDLRAHTD